MSNVKSGSSRTFWSRLVAMAESRPGARELRALSNLSDEELAARGTTRTSEMRRILGARYYC